MKKLINGCIALCFVVTPTAFAGVVMDMVSRDSAGNETERLRFHAQDGKLRMDERGGKPGDRSSMIFLGEEFIVLDHSDKSYIVMDEAMLEQMGAQISAAMQQMEQQLASMPPEQRAMVEQMMKGDMQSMMGGGDAPPPALRVEVDGAGEWQDYSCTNYSVYEGAEKTQDLCASPLKDVAGASEMMSAFRGMAAYIQKMMQSMPGPLASAMADNPAAIMDKIDGFPVRTVYYENGRMSEESTLDSVNEQDIAGDVFIVPSTYRRDDPFAGR